MINLAQLLASLPLEELKELVESSSVRQQLLATAKDRRHLSQLLSAELTDQRRIVDAILRCNSRELRLLHACLMAGDAAVLSWSRVAEAAGAPGLDQILRPVLEGLQRKGLAFNCPAGVFLPDAVRAKIPASMSDRLTLRHALGTYDAASLTRIRSKLGLHCGATKREMVDAIALCLLSPGSLIQMDHGLNEAELKVVEYLLAADGAAYATEVAADLFDAREQEDFVRYDWQNRWKSGREKNAVDTLLARGMIFVVSHSYSFNLVLVIPGDLLRTIAVSDDSRLWAMDEPAPAPCSAPPSSVMRHETLIRDVVALLAFVSTQDAPRTTTGHIHRNALKTLGRLLSDADERYSAFVYAVAREAGLIEPVGDKRNYAVSRAGRIWLRDSTPVQLQALFRAWLTGVVWGEMYFEPLQKDSDYRHAETAVRMRHAVLDILSESPPDSFMAVDSLVLTLAFRSPLLLAGNGGSDDLVPSPSDFVRRLLATSLYWMGAVEVGGTSRDSQRSDGTSVRGRPSVRAAEPATECYRITAHARALITPAAGSDAQQQPREDRFLLQANAEAFVPPYLAPEILYHLLTISDPPTAGSAGNTVRITRESVRRALDRGNSISKILEFLQTYSRTGVPQNVEFLLQDVGGKHGNIRVGRAQLYIRTDSASLLRELQARKDFKAHNVRILSETVAILDGNDPERLVKDLRKAGYLPLVDEPPTYDDDPHEIDDDSPKGSARPAQEAPSRPQHLIDWDKLARDPPVPISSQPEIRIQTPETSRPPDAVHAEALMRIMISQAIRARRVILAAYRDGSDTAMVDEIHPQLMGGDALTAYSRTLARSITLHIRDILWTKLTNETFGL